MTTVTLDACAGGKDRRMSYGRKDEEYIADFCLISRRALNDEEYELFNYHFLLGADWRLCCRRCRSKPDRGTFFHEVYRIQQKLGQVFRDLEPYGLYPLDEYFGGAVRGAVTEKVLRMPGREVRGAAALRPPVRVRAERTA